MFSSVSSFWCISEDIAYFSVSFLLAHLAIVLRIVISVFFAVSPVTAAQADFNIGIVIKIDDNAVSHP
jgi:hypothetical protein